MLNHRQRHDGRPHTPASHCKPYGPNRPSGQLSMRYSPTRFSAYIPVQISVPSLSPIDNRGRILDLGLYGTRV